MARKPAHKVHKSDINSISWSCSQGNCCCQEQHMRSWSLHLYPAGTRAWPKFVRVAFYDDSDCVCRETEAARDPISGNPPTSVNQSFRLNCLCQLSNEQILAWRSLCQCDSVAHPELCPGINGRIKGGKWREQMMKPGLEEQHSHREF